jgi:6,7-dimethyl-8-ribityllumazine synthase
VSTNEYDDSAVAQRAATDEPSDEPSDESSDESVEAAEEQVESAWPARETATSSPSLPAAKPEPATPSSEAVALDGAASETSVIEEEESAEDAAEAEPEREPEAEDEDPFAAWPQAESGVVVEDVPEEGVSVEHVEGEIDVPDGYTVLEGMPLGRRRAVAVVVSRFNGGLTNRMLAKALDALEDAEVAPDAVTVVPVPGAFELPLAAMALAKTRRYACVVALGAIVRGETPHFDYVASEAASGLQLAGIETGVPVAFGVLTVETVEQGEARIDRAADAVRTALEMADLFARLRASAH